MLDLDALKILVTIAEKGSFAAAAEALYKTPSSLSYTMSKLEQQLGVALFDRSGHRSTLTPAGELLLQEGRKMLTASFELEERVKAADRGWESMLRIVVDTLFPVEPLFADIEAFNQLQQFTQVQVFEETLGGAWERLHDGSADLLIASDAGAGHVNYECALIGELPFSFAVSPQHALAQIKRPLTDDDIKPYCAVTVNDSARTRIPLTVSVLVHQRRIGVPNMEAKIAAQVKGIGVGYLPEFRIKAELAANKLVVLKTERAKPAAKIVVAHRNGNQGKALQWFKKRLLDHFPWPLVEASN